MPDKTKKELSEIITDLKEAVSYWKKQDRDNMDLIDIKNKKLNQAIQDIADFKEKAKDAFIDRAKVIGNLINLIKGMTTAIADVDSLPTHGQMPKFLDE